MLIISFDAIGDSEFERLAEYPTIRAFARQAAVFRDVATVFPSNTYPIHASVATGVIPRNHGIIANIAPFPAAHPFWNSAEAGIRAKTLWQAAAAQGIDTAAVFWPVTAFSRSIRYNIPEVLARPGKNQLLTSLRAGSKRLQLKLFLRHRHLLDGVGQPALDDFATACMVDILREHRPGLALLHLTAYDTLCHLHGRDSDALQTAMAAMDRNLARLLKAAGDRPVIIFSDHSQLNVHTVLTPNDLLVKAGLLGQSGTAWLPGKSGCFIECGGGAAFFHAGNLSGGQIEKVRTKIKQTKGFRRFLTPAEMRDSGHKNLAFGFCPQLGFSYEATPSRHKATHGYPLDMPDYTVFYMLKGFGLPPGSTRGGSLLDIAPLAAKRLGIHL